MCTPPGLIYARAGEMRKNNKVLVLQAGTNASWLCMHEAAATVVTSCWL
jgi:hypothetical protein